MAATKTEDLSRQAMEKAREITTGVREQSSETMEKVRDMANEASRRAQEGLGQARDKAVEYYQQGRDQLQAVGQTVQGGIEQRPLTAVLIAAAAGLLLGVILARSWES